ncbi:unnamed protein product [Hermetia illucens]|uniref:Uncharacterized protein n=1 Tax=Hermetia illucens TaxID=343691 RepID=A0A7R8YUE2_HERIL|nr:unnamed protein product [Hermetia illucens]
MLTKISKIVNVLMKQNNFAEAPYDFSQHILRLPCRVLECTSGTYVHFGIAQYLEEPAQPSATIIKINIAMYVVHVIEGSTPWPKYLVIYGQQLGSGRSFIIGIYYGSFSLNSSINETLEPLVDEVQCLQNNYICFGERYLSFAVNSLITDPVTNSMVTCTAWPSSLYGCSKCKCETTFEFSTNKTIFPTTVASDLRRDSDFYSEMENSEHHLTTPVLLRMGIGLISDVVIDYKYTVCLGVVKNLINFWMSGVLQHKFTPKEIDSIDAALLHFGPSCPVEFQWEPKGIRNHRFWTAYDYRQFLIYYGPLVLRNVLSPPHYLNFFYLSIAMRIALDPKHCEAANYEVCGILLRRFVADYAILYGDDNVDHNVHYLLHLEEALIKYKCLENVGGFKFHSSVDRTEVLMMKKMSESSWTLRDLAKMVIKLQNRDKTKIDCLPDMSISALEPDNYLLMTNGVIQVQSLGFDQTGKVLLYGRRFLLSVPFVSSHLKQNIWKVSDLSSIEKFSLEQVVSKAAVFYMKDVAFAMPMLSF